MPFETLVTAEDLAAHVADPDWIVFDCRHDLADTGKESVPIASRTFPARASRISTAISLV